MINATSNKVLLRAATLAGAEWDDYSAYCRAREAGLRRLAFDHLSGFIHSMKGASPERQRKFVCWVCERLLENEPDSSPLLPEPLLSQFVLPILEEWKNRNKRMSARVGGWVF